jgi:hypothetical protein
VKGGDMVSYIDLMVALLAAVVFNIFMVLIIAFYEWQITPQEANEPPLAINPPEKTLSSTKENLMYQPVKEERTIVDHGNRDRISHLPIHSHYKKAEVKKSVSAMEKTDIENEIAKRSHTIHGLARKHRADDLPEVTNDGKHVKTD